MQTKKGAPPSVGGHPMYSMGGHPMYGGGGFKKTFGEKGETRGNEGEGKRKGSQNERSFRT